MLLVMRRGLDRDSIPRRCANALRGERFRRDTPKASRARPRFAIALKDRVKIRVDFTRPRLQTAIRTLGADVTGEPPDFDFRHFFRMRRDIQASLDRRDQLLQQKVRHHQALADVVESVFDFIDGKFPSRIVAVPSGVPVAISILQFRHGIWTKVVVAFEVQQIAQSAAKFVAVQTTDDRLRAGTAAPGVDLFQASSQGIDDMRQFIGSGPRLFFRRHLAPIQLVEHLLPGLQRLVIREVRAERIEALVVFLLLRAVTRDAVFLQKGPELRQGIICVR